MHSDLCSRYDSGGIYYYFYSSGKRSVATQNGFAEGKTIYDPSFFGQNKTAASSTFSHSVVIRLNGMYTKVINVQRAAAAAACYT